MYLIDKKVSPDRIGSKAHNLFALQDHFTVPDFLVVEVSAYAAYLKSGKIPDRLLGELRDRVNVWLTKGPVAARSSATAEDMPDFSFAGMYDTVLNVADDAALRKALIRVWDSNRGVRVEAYRKQHRITAGLMAVIIQRQLAPDVSGVMVTQSPFSTREIMIECCPGLGEPLVSGRITPSRYRITGQTIQKPDGPELLDDKKIRELVAAGYKIETMFKSAQDIEWAYEKSRLYILQSRPLTVQAASPRRLCTVWSNVNLRETIPDPITAMGWSLFTDFIFYTIIREVFTIPVTEEEYRKYPMVERLLGRLYWNLNNCMAYGKSVGRIISLFKLSSLDPQLGDAAKAVDIKNLPQPIPDGKLIFWGPLALFRLIRYLLRGFISHQSINRRVRLHYEESAQWLSRLEIAGDPEKGLANIHDWLRVWFGRFGQEYFGSIFIGLFQMIILMKLMKWRMGQKGEVLTRNAIIGILDKTGEMAMAIQGLGARARARIRRSTVRREDLRTLLKSDPVFQKAYRAFLDEFGHRGPGEFDFGKPNWRDDENMTLDVIRTATQARPYAVDRAADMTRIMSRLKPLARFFFRLFRPRLESLTPLREDGKHHFFKFGSRVKDQVFALENALIKRGYLEGKYDIFNLTLSDLQRIIDQRLSPSDCRRVIEQRKKECRDNAALQPPDIIFESGERIYAQTSSAAVHIAEPLTFGRIRARTRIIADFREAPALQKDEILVTHHSDPGWTPLFMVASGVIVEVGGLICHAAMVARELGIPAVVLKNATRLIPDGSLIELDANLGRVTIIKK
jgi:pyruvate,water dikinase